MATPMSGKPGWNVLSFADAPSEIVTEFNRDRQDATPGADAS